MTADRVLQQREGGLAHAAGVQGSRAHEVVGGHEENVVREGDRVCRRVGAGRRHRVVLAGVRVHNHVTAGGGGGRIEYLVGPQHSTSRCREEEGHEDNQQHVDGALGAEESVEVYVDHGIKVLEDGAAEQKLAEREERKGGNVYDQNFLN